MCYNGLVQSLIGTRMTRESTWGRKFDDGLRQLCKISSISRSWFIEKKRAGVNHKESFKRWQRERKEFIVAWEKRESLDNRGYHSCNTKRWCCSLEIIKFGKKNAISHPCL